MGIPVQGQAGSSPLEAPLPGPPLQGSRDEVKQGSALEKSSTHRGTLLQEPVESSQDSPGTQQPVLPGL